MGRILDGPGHAAHDIQLGKVVDGTSSNTLSRGAPLGSDAHWAFSRLSVSDKSGPGE